MFAKKKRGVFLSKLKIKKLSMNNKNLDKNRHSIDIQSEIIKKKKRVADAIASGKSIPIQHAPSKSKPISIQNNITNNQNTNIDIKPKKRKKPNIILTFLLKFFSIIATTIFSVLLITIITGTIVTTAITIYLMDFMNSSADVDIADPTSSYSSYIYTKNTNSGEYDLVYKITPRNNDARIPVDLENIPEHVKNAFIYTEDERFYSHDGVDFKRTFAAFVNLFIPIYNSQHGGSSITQQLIKNITLDDEVNWERKLREIFRAIQLEKKYTKDDILEAYLNNIYFGQSEDYFNLYGIEAASIAFFGKSVSELTVREAASLAACPKNPYWANPIADYSTNQERAAYAVGKMFEMGTLTPEEYTKAINEKVLVTNMDEFKKTFLNPKKINDSKDDFKNPEITSYAVDAALYEFCDYIMETTAIDNMDDALKKFNQGGYKLYLTVDNDLQSYLEDKYSNWDNFFYETNDNNEQIQSSFIVMNYTGDILGVVGGIGQKDQSLSSNRAVQNVFSRQPGSTIKPITTYGYALENDLITWSTYFTDTPIFEDEEGKPWPTNYTNDYWNGSFTVADFIKFSRNTLPAQICQSYGLENIFNFATKNLHVNLKDLYTTSDGRVISDKEYAPLSVGALSQGLTVENLANAYMPYGNGGLYYKSHIIDKIVSANNGEIVVDNSKQEPEQAVSPDTAFIMNRLLNEVTKTGTAPGLDDFLTNKNLVGKTGTSENWNDLTFVGLTEDFVSAIWIGYDYNGSIPEGISSANVWKKIFAEYANNYESDAKYPESENVIAAKYCTKTGLIASSSCPNKSREYGYYKESNAVYCNH